MPSQIVSFPVILLCPENFLLKHIIKTKVFPLKIFPPNLKTWLRACTDCWCDVLAILLLVSRWYIYVNGWQVFLLFSFSCVFQFVLTFDSCSFRICICCFCISLLARRVARWNFNKSQTMLKRGQKKAKPTVWRSEKKQTLFAVLPFLCHKNI